jgi:tRNA splicing endonuclease
MAKTSIKQLDSRGEIYAAVDERGCIIGTGTKEVCEFLMMLANHELETVNKVNRALQATRGNVRSAIEI